MRGNNLGKRGENLEILGECLPKISNLLKLELNLAWNGFDYEK